MPKWIKTLEDEFNLLHYRLVNELSSRHTCTSAGEVLQALTRFPLTFKTEYESKMRDMLSEFGKKKVLFFCLSPLFRFVDYELLQHLVSRFGSQELKLEMMSYTEKVQWFKKVATFDELMNHWSGFEVPTVDYNKLRAKFAYDPKSYTLEKLDSFRNRFYHKIRRSEYVTVSILMLLEPASSFIAVWFIPTVAVQELTEAISQIDRTFFQTEQILELSLGERILYQGNIAAECMTSSSAMEPLSEFAHVSNVIVCMAAGIL